MYQNCLKRFLAIVLSLLGILALGWLLVLLSIAMTLLEQRRRKHAA